MVYIKTDDVYKDVRENVETRFDCSNELDRILPKGKNKKVIALIKDELGGKMMIKFGGLTAKTYSYLKDNGSEDRNSKGCLEANKIENKINYLEKMKLTKIVSKKIIKNS